MVDPIGRTQHVQNAIARLRQIDPTLRIVNFRELPRFEPKTSPDTKRPYEMLDYRTDSRRSAAYDTSVRYAKEHLKMSFPT